MLVTTNRDLWDLDEAGGPGVLGKNRGSAAAKIIG